MAYKWLGAGAFDQRVTVERLRETTNEMNEPTQEWYDAFGNQRWAAVHPVSGREYFSGQQVQGQVSHRVVMRYDPQSSGITIRDRLKWRDSILEIVRVTDMESRKRELHLDCRESV